MSDSLDPAASLRASHVEGLRTELAFLENQRTPNAARIAAVKAQLDSFEDKPTKRTRETRKA